MCFAAQLCCPYRLSVSICANNVKMKKATISFESFEVLLRLKKNFVVVFSSSWSTKSRPHSTILSTVSSDVLIFEVSVNASSKAESYCVDALMSKNLPIACVFAEGNLWQSFEYGEMNSIPMIINGFGPIFNADLLLSLDSNKSLDVLSALFPQQVADFEDEPIYIFISGDRSSVGKSTTCLALLAALVSKGVSPSMLAYIKPVTQCEATQPVVTYCEKVGIAHQGIGPVVFYKGFTRAYLAGETDSSEQLIQSAVNAVRAIGRGKQFVLVDGVGYPGVGSICNISNADVALALQVPVLLVGKEGVGDAVDSFNLNAAFFEIRGVTVLGGIFNKLPLSGFYSLEACQAAVSSYFRQFKPAQLPYGFVPVVSKEVLQTSSADSGGSVAMEIERPFEETLSESFMMYVDVNRLLFDTWKYNKILKVMHTEGEWTRTSSGGLGAGGGGVSSSSVSGGPNVVTLSKFRGFPASAVPSTPAVVPCATAVAQKSFVTNNVIMKAAAEPQPVVRPVASLKRTREEVEREAASQGAKGG